MVNDKFDVGNSVTIVKAYEAVTNYLGFSFLEAGKTMGLSSYGKDKNQLWLYKQVVDQCKVNVFLILGLEICQWK